MAKKLYLGVNSLAKEAKKIYIGINNISKKVKKMYIGDSNGIAKEAYSGGVDPTGDTFTEEEFLSILADGNQALMHVGALITLSNQYCSTYEVIGVNHDNDADTIDIMAHTQVGNQIFSDYSQVYSSSNVRTWINDTYFNAFSTNIKAATKTMEIITNYSTPLSDRVKLLSLTEIGTATDTDIYAPTGEGNLYTGVFTPGAASAYITNRWRAAGSYGDASYYWLRSRSTGSIDYVWYVHSSGLCSYSSYTYTYGVLPVLRFTTLKPYTVDPTKSSFTEAEFLTVIAEGNQAHMTIGATITLSNTYCSTYEVIGVNHDGTSGTVDIMAHTQVGNQQFGSSQVYSSSSIRTWINGTYFNAFSDNIRNAAKTMSVVTNGSATANDKVKLLSMTEIGATNTYAPTGEGSLYTGVFTPNPSSTATTNRWRVAGTYGNTRYYWLRSRSTYGTTDVWYVRSDGNCNRTSHTGTFGVLPVLRF